MCCPALPIDVYWDLRLACCPKVETDTRQTNLLYMQNGITNGSCLVYYIPPIHPIPLYRDGTESTEWSRTKSSCLLSRLPHSFPLSIPSHWGEGNSKSKFNRSEVSLNTLVHMHRPFFNYITSQKSAYTVWSMLIRMEWWLSTSGMCRSSLIQAFSLGGIQTCCFFFSHPNFFV